MKLFIDIGNSRIKYYWQANIYTNIDDLLELVNSKPIAAPIKAYLISTVPEKNQQVITELEEKLGANLAGVEIFDPQAQTTLGNIYEGIGADRVAKLIGAMSLNPSKEIILIDFGTATTATAAASDSTLAASYISLGLEKTFRSLAEETAQLPDMSSDFKNYFQKGLSQVNESKSETIAMSPELSIVQGSYLAHLALLDGWQKEIKRKLPQSISICTGGLAELFQEKFDFHIEESKLLEAAFRSE